MLAVLALPGMAAAPLVRDEMGLFDADTYNELEQSAEAASSGHDCDVYFLVVNDIGDANQRDFAKNYYVNNGLGSGEGKSGITTGSAGGFRLFLFPRNMQKRSPTNVKEGRRPDPQAALALGIACIAKWLETLKAAPGSTSLAHRSSPCLSHGHQCVFSSPTKQPRRASNSPLRRS